MPEVEEKTAAAPDLEKKVGNLETGMKSLLETNQKLSEQLSKLKQPEPPRMAIPQPKETKASWKERFYQDEDAAVQEIQTEATQAAVQTFQNMQRLEAQRQQVIGQLVADYPELADPNADLRKKAQENFEKLPPEDQASPYAYKIAARDAAAELGVLPKHKRKEKEMPEDDDSFSVGGKGGEVPRADRKRKGKEGELSDATLQFAELLGRPVNDEKYRERLKTAAKRDRWERYKPV